MVISLYARAIERRHLMVSIFASERLPMMIPRVVSKGGWRRRLCPESKLGWRGELGPWGRINSCIGVNVVKEGDWIGRWDAHVIDWVGLSESWEELSLLGRCKHRVLLQDCRGSFDSVERMTYRINESRGGGSDSGDGAWSILDSLINGYL